MVLDILNLIYCLQGHGYSNLGRVLKNVNALDANCIQVVL